jgi:vacuolar-type H+-ATPase subunit D/Vma8
MVSHQELLEMKKQTYELACEVEEIYDSAKKVQEKVGEMLKEAMERMDRLEAARMRSPPMRVSLHRRSRPSSKHRKPLGRRIMNHKK